MRLVNSILVLFDLNIWNWKCLLKKRDSLDFLGFMSQATVYQELELYMGLRQGE